MENMQRLLFRLNFALHRALYYFFGHVKHDASFHTVGLKQCMRCRRLHESFACHVGGEFQEGHKLDAKTAKKLPKEMPKKMIGRMLTRKEVTALLKKLSKGLR